MQLCRYLLFTKCFHCFCIWLNLGSVHPWHNGRVGWAGWRLQPEALLWQYCLAIWNVSERSMCHRNPWMVGQVVFFFRAFDSLITSLLQPSTNGNSNSNTPQATTLSKLLEQCKKQAAAARQSWDLHKCKLFARLQAISDHFWKVDHIFSKLFTNISIGRSSRLNHLSCELPNLYLVSQLTDDK